MKKRIKLPISTEILEILIDDKVSKDDTYAFVLNKVSIEIFKFPPFSIDNFNPKL